MNDDDLVDATKNARSIYPNSNVVKILGTGMFGRVYLLKTGKKKYAMKVQKILKRDTVADTSSPIYREIEFSKIMYQQFPHNFMKLYAHKIIYDCKHPQKIPKLTPIDPNIITGREHYYEKLAVEYSKLNKSSICSVNIWTKVDGTFEDVITKLDYTHKSAIYDLMIQYLYIVYALNINNYEHCDLHTGNIGLKKTKNKYISILNHKVKTHGIYVVALDYGIILHKDYILTSEEEKKWDIVMIYYFLFLLLLHYIMVILPKLIHLLIYIKHLRFHYRNAILLLNT
jgi:hypothetical protein